ncbi:BTAD domain-containing putative transcriptional regulator [Streptomyces sp. NPDC051567]|uniref:BTAD domain-containing putative transcriptional regulator n=1 Tax=Streptomyces sp. NPDC051567 TaxID=3365660 RepID=UPI0037955755
MEKEPRTTGTRVPAQRDGITGEIRDSAGGVREPGGGQSQRLSIAALGPLTARAGGRELAIGPPRRRALLALLLIRVGHVVPLGQLIDELWGETPPRRPTATLQSHISHLRRVLSQEGRLRRPTALVRFRAPGYELEIVPEDIDVLAFEEGVLRGRRLLAEGDARGAREAVAASLSLWRGCPYAELSQYAPLAAESSRLQDVRLGALEVLAEARLHLGDNETVAAELGREFAEHPLRERLVGHLMTALYRLGRQAEALRIYERTRLVLAEELGVDASAELQALHTRMLRQNLAAPGQVTRHRSLPHASAPAGGSGPSGPPARGPRTATVPGPGPAPGHAADPPPAPSREEGGPPVSSRAAGDPPAPGLRVEASAGRAARPGTEPRRAKEARTGAEDRTAAETRSRTGTAADPAEELPATGAFVGRERELAALRATLAHTRTGGGRLITVHGEAGIGKTRLLEEVAALGRPGEDIVWGHAHPGGEAPPYWLWTQVLRQLATLAPETFRTAHASRALLLAPLSHGQSCALPEDPAGLPVPGTGSPARDAARLAFLTRDAVCETLLAFAGQRPLVLFLEDLQWADTESVEVVRLMGTRLHGRALTVVATARDSGTNPALHRTVLDVVRSSREAFRLQGLTAEQVRELLGSQAGPGVSLELARSVQARGHGNPYTIQQLLSMLGDVRRLHDAQASRVLFTDIPAGVQESVRHRLAGLSPQVQDVLRVCAVLGARSDLYLVQELVDGPRADIAASVESALRTGLLTEDPRFPGQLSFSQPLDRETLVAAAGHAERGRLHARVARVLAARGDVTVDREHIAHHAWQAAGALPESEALPLLARAAQEAESRHAYDEAETWLRRAARLLPGLPAEGVRGAESLRAERQLQLNLGSVVSVTCGPGHGDTLTAYRRAEALQGADPRERACALWGLTAWHLVRARYARAQYYSALLSELGAETGDPVALVGAACAEGVVSLARGRADEARVLLDTAVGLADSHVDACAYHPAPGILRDPRVIVRLHSALAHWMSGDRAAVSARRAEALAATHGRGGPPDRATALYLDALVAALDGDQETAVRSGGEGLELAERHGMEHWAHGLRVCRGWGRVRPSGTEELLAQLWETVHSPSVSHLSHFPLHLGLLADAQYRAGDRDGAAATLAAMRDTVGRQGSTVFLTPRLPFNGLFARL